MDFMIDLRRARKTDFLIKHNLNLGQIAACHGAKTRVEFPEKLIPTFVVLYFV
jgi:hypothetical protein